MISAILYNHHKAAYPYREKTYTIMAIQYLGRLPRESEDALLLQSRIS